MREIIKNKNYLLIGIIFVGVVLRLYKPLELFMYSHDQDLLSWFVKDVLINHNLRLIGQETSVHGVFIGPLFYYAMVPFYFISNMNPVGGIIFVTLIAALTIGSIYYVFKKMFSRGVGYIGSLLYATSFYSVMTDREVVPTTPTILWCVWALFTIHLFLKKQYKYAFLLTGILVGLIWHISMGLILISPLFLVSFLISIFSEKNLKKVFIENLKYILFGVGALMVLMSPYIVFELRHGFVQTEAILSSSSGEAVQTFSEKLDRTFTLTAKNIVGFTWGPYLNLPERFPLYLFIGIFAFLVVKKKISRTLCILLSFWLLAFIFFFSNNSLNLSEYYLNGMLVVELFIFSLFLHFLYRNKTTKLIPIVLVFLFLVANLMRLFTIPINRSGFLERSAIVSFIKEDAKAHNYPCVSISYITEPGFNLGYRYLFFIEKMHVDEPSGGAPVYTVVFPHSRVDKIDKSFGALGMVLPDYSRYNPEELGTLCSGPNQNEVGSLFGYVQ